MSLSKDRTIYYELENLITSVYNQHVQELPEIYVFEREREPRPMCLIFTKNSPLTPFFKEATQKSIQMGLRDALIKEWFGPKIKPVAHSESFALGIGQTFLIFIVMGTALILAFLIFLAELLFPKVHQRFLKSKKSVTSAVIPEEREKRMSFEEFRLSNTNLSSLYQYLFPGQLKSKNQALIQTPEPRRTLHWKPIEQV